MSTRHYCDRCVGEIEELKQLTFVTLEMIGGGRCISRPVYELCAACTNEVQRALAGAGVAK